MAILPEMFELAEWAAQQKITLEEDPQKKDRKYFYRTGKPSNVFQIVVEPPEAGYRRIDLYQIESSLDEEARVMWNVPVGRCREALEEALDLCVRWPSE